MNLQPTTVDIVVQHEFLRNTQDLQFKTAGAVLDAAGFDGDNVTDGFIKAGTAVMQDADGFYVPFNVGENESVADVKGAGLTTSDIKADADAVELTGILIAGHPLEDKCTGVTDKFKEAVKGYLRFDV